MLLTDTILALSSPPSPARRAILRLSGPHAWPAAAQLLPLLPQPLTPGWHGPLPLPLLHPTAKIAHALFFQSPRSFTGQDIAELHLPASPALLNAVSEKILSQNPAHIRLAHPGEFSARAFFNGKIDLTQAEGIAATINAANESQLKAAASLRSGNLHRWIANLADRLAEILALLEANIDFVEEEDIHLIDAPLFLDRLSQLTTELQSQLDNSLRLDRLDSLPTVVFVGPPNVGKSSLINALTNSDRSITSPIAGTTRDTLSALLHTPAGDIRLLDVPGEESPTDDLRQKMMRTRQSAIDEADLIIEVVTHSPLPAAHTMTIHNKSDLLPTEKISPTWQYVSAKTGLHLDLLREEITTRLTHRPPLSAHLPALNQRHRTLLQQTLATLQTTSRLVSNSSLRSHPELLAADLRHSLDLLGQITGAISPDQIIGRIFSQFCIGK